MRTDDGCPTTLQCEILNFNFYITVTNLRILFSDFFNFIFLEFWVPLDIYELQSELFI